MPQMAPMMWQMIYISCLCSMMMVMTKNFFMDMNLTKSNSKLTFLKNEMTWKW